ncbi:MAG: hypothetical protein QJR03_12370 [Sphaerobacter sp.]|nr:hypothetical protein [Sphaerobacter sp.]
MIVELGYAPWVTDGEEAYVIRQVIGFREGTRLGRALHLGPDHAAIQLADGVLDARVARAPRSTPP